MKSKVIDLEKVNTHIALITMRDKVNKNTFTDEFIEGLGLAFREIENDTDFKVVVITGYDSYFCAGGTKDALLAIHNGRTTFNGNTKGEHNVYSLPLDCNLPVIAAMQGHAIGGGLAFGLFSDFVILSSESIYTASFMKYGFTPGFGATYIFPEKLGLCLAQEFLITARTFRGDELRKRGVPFEIYMRKDVLEKAMELAELIAEKPRISLITLKSHLVDRLRKELPITIEKEIVMHEITFHLPEVKNNIDSLYN